MQYINDIETYIHYTHYMTTHAIANRLKVARVEVNMTQSELADHVGVARQTIGLIEAGRYNPSLALCIKLALATGKTLDGLFWPEGDE